MMKLKVVIEEINYGDAAVKILPVVGRSLPKSDDAVPVTLSAITQLPEKLIYDICDAIPVEQKNRIAAAFVREYKPTVLPAINKLSAENRLGVYLSDLSLDHALSIEATADNIDYLCLAERFLWVIKKKLMNMGGMIIMLQPMIRNASATQVCNLMDRFLGDRKDSFLASIINQNKQMLISVIEDAAKQQNVRLTIRDLSVEA